MTTAVYNRRLLDDVLGKFYPGAVFNCDESRSSVLNAAMAAHQNGTVALPRKEYEALSLAHRDWNRFGCFYFTNDNAVAEAMSIQDDKSVLSTLSSAQSLCLAMIAQKVIEGIGLKDQQSDPGYGEKADFSTRRIDCDHVFDFDESNDGVLLNTDVRFVGPELEPWAGSISVTFSLPDLTPVNVFVCDDVVGGVNHTFYENSFEEVRDQALYDFDLGGFPGLKK